MPLKSSSIYSLGLFGESDLVSLSPTLSIYRGRLFDHITGAKHRLHHLAEAALLPLGKGILFHKWLVYMLEEQLTMDEITDIISFLNSIGGFEVKRTRFSAWKLGLKRLAGLAVGLSLNSLACRRLATFQNIIYTVSRACLPLVSLSVVVGLLLYASGFLSLSAAMIDTAVFLWLILLSTVVHEYIHLRLIRLAGRQPILLQRGMRLGILHRPLSRQKEALSAISGPLVGGLTAVLLAAVLSSITGQRLILGIGVLIAFFHAVSLLPAYGDGQSLKLWGGKASTR